MAINPSVLEKEPEDSENLVKYPLTEKDFPASELEIIKEISDLETKEYWENSEYKPEDFYLEGGALPDDLYRYKYNAQEKFNEIISNVFQHYFSEFSFITEHEISIHNPKKRQYSLKCLIRLLQDLPNGSKHRQLILNHEDYIRLFDAQLNSAKEHKELCEHIVTLLNDSPIQQVLLRDINFCVLNNKIWHSFITGIVIDNTNFGMQGLLVLCEFLSKTPQITTLNLEYSPKKKTIQIYDKYNSYLLSKDYSPIDEIIPGVDIFSTNGLSLFGKNLAKTGIKNLAFTNIGIGTMHPNEVLSFFSALTHSKVTCLSLNHCMLGNCNLLPDAFKMLEGSTLKELTLRNNHLQKLISNDFETKTLSEKLEDLESFKGYPPQVVDSIKAIGCAFKGLTSLTFTEPKFAAALLDADLMMHFAESIKASSIKHLTLEMFSEGILRTDIHSILSQKLKLSNDQKLNQILVCIKIILANPQIITLKLPCLEFYYPNSSNIYNKSEISNVHQYLIVFFSALNQSCVKELVINKTLYYVNGVSADTISKMFSENRKLEKVSLLKTEQYLFPDKDHNQGMEKLMKFMDTLTEANKTRAKKLSFLMGTHSRLGSSSQVRLCETDPARTRYCFPLIFKFAGLTNCTKSLNDNPEVLFESAAVNKEDEEAITQALREMSLNP